MRFLAIYRYAVPAATRAGTPCAAPTTLWWADMDSTAPDRAALEVAHSWLHTPARLDDMLEIPALKIILVRLARRHMQRRSGFDAKKLQANDKE